MVVRQITNNRHMNHMIRVTQFKVIYGLRLKSMLFIRQCCYHCTDVKTSNEMKTSKSTE